MSTQPPPFNQYGTPPPGGNYGQPRNSSGGCWKAAGITCGVLLVLGIIAIVAAVNYVKHSGIGTAFQGAISSTKDGLTIQKAVVAYHHAHGKYPDNLTTLVADGSIDGKILHSSLDPNHDPGHISWTYFKPTESSPPNAPLLSLHFTITVPSGNAPQTSGGDIVINLDGSTPAHPTPLSTPGGS